MTVLELINELLHLPPTRKVMIPSQAEYAEWDECYEESTSVWTEEDGNVYIS